MQYDFYAVKDKLKKQPFGKKDKKVRTIGVFLSYISRGVIQKDKPQDAERGASNETTAMAENQDRLILGSPYLILDEPT